MKYILPLLAALLLLSTGAIAAKSPDTLTFSREGVSITLTQKACTNPVITAMIDMMFEPTNPYKKKFMAGTITFQNRTNDLCYVINDKNPNEIFIIDADDGPVGVVEIEVKKPAGL